MKRGGGGRETDLEKAQAKRLLAERLPVLDRHRGFRWLG